MLTAVSRSNHSIEQELLRLCASRFLNTAEADRIRELISPDTDWNYLLGWAQDHRLLPLLYTNLKEICSGQVPPHVLESLRGMYFLTASRNLRLSGELLRLIGLFESHGVEVVPFKGPVLADILFRNVSLRQFGDLDILVEPADVGKARHLLLADGYQPEFVLSGKIESEYVRSEHAFQFHKEEGGFVVELHWRFGSRDQAFPVIPSEVWPRLESRKFQGRTIRSLSPEDLFLYLCMHGAKHAWDRLEWISCLGETIRTEYEMNWAEVARRARKSGATRGLHLGLLLAQSQGQLSLPPDIERAARADVKAGALACQALSRLFVHEPDHSRREVYRHAFYLRSRERWRDRIRIVVFSSARIPHPLAKDWSLFRIPVSMSFLYYLLRPLRLIREYGFRRLRAMLRPNPTFPEEKYL